MLDAQVTRERGELYSIVTPFTDRCGVDRLPDLNGTRGRDRRLLVVKRQTVIFPRDSAVLNHLPADQLRLETQAIYTILPPHNA
jgi:hypothetical protein